MTNIETLLNKLNKLEPLPQTYEALLRSKLMPLPKKNDSVILKPGQFAEKAWVLLSGYILTMDQDADGNITVIDIHSSGDICIDMPSFFLNERVTYKYLAVGNVEVLELNREDYLTLTKFPETAKLVQKITLLELKRTREKLRMYLLSPKEMIVNFLKDYNVTDLPDEYCASFLRTTLENYMELKVLLLKTGEIEISTGIPKYGSQALNMKMVYEVQSYLLENYSVPGISDIMELSRLFNTTKKHLTTHLRATLGATACQLVFKIRMEKAHSLLLHDKLPAKDVYKQVGYNDVYYFGKKFKEYFGFTTKEVHNPQNNHSIL